MTAWLFAFLIHSTFWCLLAWLLVRLCPRTHARIREAIWSTAIAASLITPTVQTLVSAESTLWHVQLPTALVAEQEGGHGEQEGPPAGWQSLVHWAWLAVAGALVLCHGGRLEALRRRLGQREPVRDPRLHSVLVELCRRAGLSSPPRLTESENLGSPIALGLGPGREICLPTRALHELDPDQMRALLGHEVAHHLRRDTLWLATLNTLQSVFFFQPFFRLAARAIHRAAEEQCDDWSASQLDDRLAMASCLTEVAAWARPQDRHLVVPCMARRCSPLRSRVDRLMDGSRRLDAPGRWRRGLCCAALLALSPWLAPTVAPAREHSGWASEVEHHDRGEHHDREHEGAEGHED